MKNKRKIKIIAIASIIVMSLILIYAGHYLFYGNIQPPIDNSGKKEAKPAEKPESVRYIHLSSTINGSKQEIHIIEADISDKDVKILPVLSNDLIYGFENLSSMAARKQAFAAVNGGFFTQYGLPSGMVVIDGMLISASKGRYPVFLVEKGKASLAEIESKLQLECKSSTLEINGINRPAQKNEAVVYTPVYGSSNRAKQENLTITIRKGVVSGIGSYAQESEIPGEGMLVSIFRPHDANYENIQLKKGDAVKLIHKPQLSPDTQAYECGSWIVKDGQVVIGNKDEWVGVLTNQDPRTAVGIKKDGTVVFIVVDGRQPGYSRGMTGRELGEFLRNYGVENAAMLDGGASSEMIFGGKIVNKPSFKGQERPLAGGLIIKKAQ